MKPRRQIAEARPDRLDNSSISTNERAHQVGEQLQKLVLNSRDIAVIITDERGLTQSFNAGAERMLGYAAGEVVNRLSPSDFQDPEDSIARALSLGAPVGARFETLSAKASRGIEDKCEITYVRKDGTRFPALVSIRALRDDQNGIMGYVLIANDISDLKAAAETKAVKLLQAEVVNYHNALERERSADLRDSQEMFRQLATHIPEALWIKDIGAATLRYVNPVWEEMTGRRAAAGDKIERLFEAFHPDDMQHVIQAAEDFPNGGADLECRFLRPDGHVRWAHVRTFPITDSEGKIYRVAGFLDDITERRVESERVERLKDEFVSTVSHELRTPLTSIAGSLGLLVGNAAGNLPESAARLLSIAQTNSQRLVRLINDILDIEKIESGKVVYELEQIELRSVVQQSIEAIKGFAQTYGITVRLHGASANGEVCADRDRLIQVFTNLLSNAVKFSPQGREVIVTIDKRGSALKVSVRDHGPGIPDTFKGQIFEKFAQADNSDARQRSGSGLGLSIAQQIVLRLGGEIGFDDAPGGGTVFHVRLPEWNRSSKRRTLIEGSADAPRILLCEDDAEVAIVLCERLWQAGFATDVAYSTEAALKNAATTSYSAIVIDLQDKGGDEIDLIKQLRAQPKCASALLLTASADPDSSVNSHAAAMLNVQDWLDKPVGPDRLIRVFSRFIVPGSNARPRILHIDNDYDMIRIIAQTLNRSADVMAAQSLDDARHILAVQRFDAIVLNLALAEGSALDGALKLRDREGDALPVIMLSDQGETAPFAARLRAGLTRSRIGVDGLVETIRKHLAEHPAHGASDKDAA